MAFRFRRRITILPGLRLNISKRSMSLSAGIRGASVTANKDGIWGNVGAPGTGLSYRSRLQQTKGQSKSAHNSPPRRTSTVKLSLDERGKLLFGKDDGTLLTAREKRRLWQQHADELRTFLQAEMEKINGDMDLLLNIHEDTPPPATPPPQYEPAEFKQPAPEKPTVPAIPAEPQRPAKAWYHNLVPGLWAWLERRWQQRQQSWARQAQAAAKHREQLLADWQATYQQWQTDYQQHQQAEQAQQAAFNQALYEDPAFMEELLVNELQQLSWPRETQVDFDLLAAGRHLVLDVDLPEPGSLPDRSARFNNSEKRLLIKDKSQRQQREEYARHIHGLVLRLLGVCFTTLPGIQQVWVSAYTQRLNQATGHTHDDYLLAVKVQRERWQQLNFDNLTAINPVAALDHFDLHRNMTKTGIFRPVKPLTPPT